MMAVIDTPAGGQRYIGEGSAAMPDDEHPPARRALIDAMWQAWTLAGPVSYTEFEKLSREVLGSAGYLPRSTVQGHLKDRDRSQPPRWEWVFRFWKVLRVLAGKHGIDPDGIGTLAELKRLHEAADAEALQARHLAAVPGCRRVTEPLASVRPGHVSGVDGTSWPGSAQGSPEADVGDEVLTAIRRRVGKDWWHSYRDVVPGWLATYLSLEPAASLIRVYDTLGVPGLLQTEAYANAALRLEPFTLPPAAITRMIELRMRRQQVIFHPNENGPRLWALLDENALRPRLGGPQVMRRQLAHLIRIAEYPNVTIQVIPSATVIRTALSFPVTTMRFPIHDVPDVAYFGQLTSALYLHDAGQVSRYTRVLDGLAIAALSPADTVSYLNRLLREI
jgi:hypothetical protein